MMRAGAVMHDDLWLGLHIKQNWMAVQIYEREPPDAVEVDHTPLPRALRND
jgi:hypothetical protein